MGIVRELGRVCRELREARYGKDGGWHELAVHISKHHGQDKRSLQNFETGEPVRFVDEKISGYASACEITLVEIVGRLQLEDDLQLPEADDDPEPLLPRPESADTQHGAKNPASASEGTSQ